MAAKGTNCTLQYDGPKNTRGYRVRVDMITLGFKQIASESQARQHKAYYPRRTAPTGFDIRVLLIGYQERNRLSRWLAEYASYALEVSGRTKVPQMRVHAPSRNFMRYGVPTTGMQFGDHLGSMVFTPTISFQTSGEPRDLDDKFWVSKVYASLANVRSPETKFFYPTGTQLAGDAAPATGQDSTLNDVVRSNDSTTPTPLERHGYEEW